MNHRTQQQADKHYAGLISGKMWCEGAMVASDAEIKRCLTPTVGGRTMIEMALRLRDSGTLPYNLAERVQAWMNPDQIDKALRANYSRRSALALIVTHNTTSTEILEDERWWAKDDFGEEPGFGDIEEDYFRAQYIADTEEITVDDARYEMGVLDDEVRRLLQYKADIQTAGHTAQTSEAASAQTPTAPELTHHSGGK